jgi:hypothetical protein
VPVDCNTHLPNDLRERGSVRLDLMLLYKEGSVAKDLRLGITRCSGAYCCSKVCQCLQCSEQQQLRENSLY